jgi:hypothetical protein
MVKYVETSPLSDPETAARKLVEIASGVEAVQDGRIFVELVNRPFLNAAERLINISPRWSARSRWAGSGVMRVAPI